MIHSYDPQPQGKEENTTSYFKTDDSITSWGQSCDKCLKKCFEGFLLPKPSIIGWAISVNGQTSKRCRIDRINGKETVYDDSAGP